MTENVTSLEAAQELEIRLRQLRFHSLLYVSDPTPERRSSSGDTDRLKPTCQGEGRGDRRRMQRPARWYHTEPRP